MKKIFTILFSFIILSQTYSQSTALRVYQIFQSNCTTSSCHSNSFQAGSLDLEGNGASESIRLNDVNSNIKFVSPANSHAAAAGNSLMYPGRVDKSFLFRKINEGLEPTLSLHPNEIPTHGDAGLTETEKEMIRQWIVWGSPLSGEVVEESLLDTYYNVGGLESFPSGPPAAPDPAEGFQIKMGPFFVPDQPSANLEVYQKYELDFPTNVEIHRLETFMSNFSHHFILYDYNNSASANSQSHGLRFNPDHFNVNVTKAVQEPTDLKLPQGAAFFWDSDQVLDLNSHYINYVGNVPYKAEVYLNVYFQQPGIAEQEMKAEILANTSICVPPNGDEVTFQQTVNFFQHSNVFLWGLMGHTHQLGTGYQAWERVGGVKGDMIYDAACFGGVPGCPSPFFDYRHIPMRYFNPFKPLTINFLQGLVHEASYINNGNQAVCWGDTSEDEMMVMVFMYLTDTTGVITSTGYINPLEEVLAYPNPANETTTIQLPANSGEIDLIMYDLLGKEIRRVEGIREGKIILNKGHLAAGAYLYQIFDKKGNFFSGKIIFR